MLNKLDDKVIIDRDVLRRLLDDSKKLLSLKATGLLGDFVWHPSTHEIAERALAQDPTGYVVTLAVPTHEMAHAGRNARYNTYVHPLQDASMSDRISYAAMLAACPPLPEGGK